MYKNNFDEVFERVYGDSVFSRYMRQRRVSVIVKWAAYIGALALIIFITRLFGIELTDLKITVLALFWLFLAPVYWLIVRKLGFDKLSDTVFHSLLSSVLDGCFDEEVTSCSGALDKEEYEKSSPEERHRNFSNALFHSSEFALKVRSRNAEITVWDASFTETYVCDGGFDNSTFVTKMIFASARFFNKQIPFNRGEVFENTYVSVYGDTLYIEIDGKSLSIDAFTKNDVRKNCREICDSIEKIIEITDIS